MNYKEDLFDNETANSAAASPAATEDERAEQRLAWFREARLGLFVHWGLYSGPAGIWNGEEVKASYAEHLQLKAGIPVKEYEKLADRFHPVKFDAKAWARTAKEAGLNYLIFTAKHHDGFAMYDSRVSPYNIVQETPFARDPLKELAQACREEGVRLCIYYSHAMDWHHPDSQGNTLDYPQNIGAYDPVEAWIGDDDKRTRFERYLNEKAFPQLTELLTEYGDIGILWFDCGHKLTRGQGERFVAHVRSLQPDCLVNRRVWQDPLGDYGNTSDNQPHVRVTRRDWESIITLNDSWGYKKTDNNWKSPEEVLRQMIDVVSLNGNFVINIGPTGEGEIDPMSASILRRIGDWLKENGESIYGAGRSPLPKPPWGRCTAKGNTLYAHVFDEPASGELVVPGLTNRVRAVYALADPQRRPLAHERMGEQDLRISLAALRKAPKRLPYVVAIECEDSVEGSPLPLLFERDFDTVFGAFDGEIRGAALRYDTGKRGRDNVTNWTQQGDELRWRFRAAAPGTFGVIAVYGCAPEQAGSRFSVTAADHTLQGEVQATEGDYDFHPFRLGEIAIPGPGEYEVCVRGDRIAREMLMNLKELRLFPV